ncbi:CHAT domain-containing protein [Streptomyces sp. NPDC102476]|uniref:CHAT domain-containing protein n=1 Tax=Streptomyces sp. NPDC102476 TaxID=3366181 RepID=UPI0037FB9F7E
MEELVRVVAQHPVLRSPDVVAEQHEHGQFEKAGRELSPAERGMVALREGLFEDLVRLGPRKAWRGYTSRQPTAHSAFLEELSEKVEAVRAADERGEANWELADRCAELANAVVVLGAVTLAGRLWSVRGRILLDPRLSSAEDREEALAALTKAAELHERAGDSIAAAETRSNLALAYRYRTVDRIQSIERCIEIMEELVPFWHSVSDPDSEAKARTNLASALMDRPSDRQANAARALAECEVALLHRTRERNALDYTYTLTTKALAHSRLIEADDSHLDKAEQTYEEALASIPPDSDPALLGLIHRNLVSLLLDAARHQSGERHQLIARAQASARSAVAVHQEHGHVRELAYARQQLAEVLLVAAPEQEQIELEARELLIAVLEELTPFSDPTGCGSAASDLMKLSERLGDWPSASRAGLIALAAGQGSAAAMDPGRKRPLREEQESDPYFAEAEHQSLYRFTAYAMFRTAMASGLALNSTRVQSLLAQAVWVMESGRATALRFTSGAGIGELEQLRTFDPDLAEAYVDAVHERGEAARGATAEGQGQPDMDTLLATIRGLPTFEGFARRVPSVAEIQAALAPGQAVVYLLPHPEGCCAFIVAAPTTENPQLVIPVDFPDLSGRRMLTFMFGFGMRSDGSPDGLRRGRPRPGHGLLYTNSLPRFRLVLRKVLAEIGPCIAQPLARELKHAGVTDAVLVTCGMMPVFAWHAAPWRNGRLLTCLTQELASISYAPSAGAWMVGRSRAERLVGHEGRLVGLADPPGAWRPLPGAQAELRHIASLFPERSHTAFGTEATRAFLLKSLPKATHVYLGCHGEMSYRVSESAVLLLADGEKLNLTHLRQLVARDLRLVVVAACVSGTVNVLWQPEEVHALSLGFMQAGAAGVVAALWPIPDLATALFITRFYELLTCGPGEDPARALTQAQQWLRTLTRRAVRGYIAERPALQPLGIQPIPRRRRPYADPVNWAGFVLQGC